MLISLPQVRGGLLSDFVRDTVRRPWLQQTLWNGAAGDGKMLELPWNL